MSSFSHTCSTPASRCFDFLLVLSYPDVDVLAELSVDSPLISLIISPKLLAIASYRLGMDDALQRALHDVNYLHIPT